MPLLTRIARATALISLLLATPALADNKKVTLSQAFQSMLYLPLYVAIDKDSSPSRASISPRKPPAHRRSRSRP